MNPMQELSEQFADMQKQNMDLQESVNDLLMRAEDVGWEKIVGEITTDGPDLNLLHDISETLRDMTAGNPLLKRGAQLRHAYAFGRGVVFTGMKPAGQKIMDDRYNKGILFSVNAYETMNLAMYTDGNLFVIYDNKTQEFINVPLSQITGVVTDPRDSERIRYLQRSWSNDGKESIEWYALDKYKGVRAKTISKNPVNQSSVIFHHASNRQGGWTFGIPDSFAAVLWVKAYSEYLADNKKLVKALAQFAWKVTAGTRAGAANVAAKVAVPGTAGTAVMANGNDLSAIPRAGSDVNFNNGQPLAAMIAASLGVSVIALIASPGAAGGSYGAAATLDFPTIRVMESVQDGWVTFFEGPLAALKSPAAECKFPSIESDAVYREIQSASQAYAQGALFQEEFRSIVLNLLDIAEPLTGLPKADGFNAWKDPNAVAVAGANPVPGQGNTGAVGNINSDITNNEPVVNGEPTA